MFITYRFIEKYFSNTYENKADLAANEAVSQLGKDCFGYELGSESFDYTANKQKLESIRTLADVNSIYFIKQSEGKQVYVISSFDSYKDSYVPGSEIDEEIQKAALQALLGETFFEKCTLSAEKGKSYEAYVYTAPVFDENAQIIGAVGMEFNDEDFFLIKDTVNKTVIPFACALALIFVILAFVLINNAVERYINDVIYVDNLTGLNNRHAYEDMIESLDSKIKNGLGEDLNFSIIVYDINDLKIVNDTLGHLVGDKYIIASAKIIDDCFGSLGATYRIGGDEFVTIVIDSSAEEVVNALEVFELTQDRYNIDNDSSPFVMSIAAGCDHFSSDTDSGVESVIDRADDKMYKAKKEKKKRFDRSPR